MDNQLDQQKSTVSKYYIWLICGVLCCSSSVPMAINAHNGTSTIIFGIIDLVLTGIVGISIIYRAIKCLQEVNPMPILFVWFVWIIVALPTVLSLWGILFAIFNISNYWVYFFNVIPVIIGVMAIAHVYENKTDAFYLIKVFLFIQAFGVLFLLIDAIDSATLLNWALFVFKFVLVTIGFLYIYFSKGIKAALPVETRTKSRLVKWLLIIIAVH